MKEPADGKTAILDRPEPRTDLRNILTDPEQWIMEPRGIYRIRYSDCDPLGHLNNARYIDYFLNAREDQIRDHYGLDIPRLHHDFGFVWLVTHTEIAYLTPALPAEEVLIRTRLIEIGARTLLLEGLMLDLSDRQLKAIVWIEFTFTDASNGRSRKHPEELLPLYETVLHSPGCSTTRPFKERISAIRTELRKKRAN